MDDIVNARRFQVFLSSTYTDLIEERQAAMRAVLEMGHFPAGMEWFAATDEDAWTLISQVIAESDFYLLIIGGRYGSTDTAGISFTEREYDHALSLGKHIIPILHKDPNVLPRNRTDANDAAWEKLEKFIAKVKRRHTCSFWEDASELRARAFSGLLHAINQHPDGGWVKADILPVVSVDLERQNKSNSPPATVSLHEALIKNINAIDRLYASDKAIDGISTGLKDLDMLTGGVHPGEVITIAGRPSMGSTVLALSIVLSVARAGLPVLIISPRHPVEDISKRLLSITSGVDASMISSGKIPDEKWPSFTSAIQTLSELHVDIQDSPTLTLEDLSAICASTHEKFGAVPLVVVDAVDLLMSDEVSKKWLLGLRALSIKYNTAMVLTAYIKRETESRPDKRPRLSDFAHSIIGTISDRVIFVYNDQIYNYDSPDRGTVELILAANKGGRLGVVRVAYLGNGCGFVDYPRSESNM